MLQVLAGYAGDFINYDFLVTWGGRLLSGLQITIEVVLISCSIG